MSDGHAPRVREPGTAAVHDLVTTDPDRWVTACQPDRGLVRTWRVTADATTCVRCLASRGGTTR